MHQRCTASLPWEERELRESALYVMDNLAMVKLALQLCDFRDVSVSVEAKHVRTRHPSLRLVHLAIVQFVQDDRKQVDAQLVPLLARALACGIPIGMDTAER